MAEEKDDIKNLTVFGYKAPNKTVQPSLPITNSAFVYRQAAATDVRFTWRKFGWAPVERK